MMHAAPRGIAGADGGLERSSCQPRIDRAADGITYDPTGPRIEGDSHVHEAGRDGDIGDVSHPKLVRTIQCHGRRKIGADRIVVINCPFLFGSGTVAIPAQIRSRSRPSISAIRTIALPYRASAIGAAVLEHARRNRAVVAVRNANHGSHLPASVRPRAVEAAAMAFETWRRREVAGGDPH